MKNSIKTAIAAAGLALLVPAIASANTDPQLTAALKSDIRKDDSARDKYRNPAETLNFFQVKPSHTLVEYGPGGGWYTRVLLPYIEKSGKYIAINTDSGNVNFRSRAREARAKGWTERFPGAASEWTGIPAEGIAAFESDEVPEEMLGTVDRVVIFRSMHGMLNGDRSDSEIGNLRKMLKDDGLVGVVQHRANADAPYAWSNGSKGYLRQKDVIALFEVNGFELVDSSEINANPKDTKDYEAGVWTLPPVRGADKENDAKYQAIGESDRMTLLFKKRS